MKKSYFSSGKIIVFDAEKSNYFASTEVTTYSAEQFGHPENIAYSLMSRKNSGNQSTLLSQLYQDSAETLLKPLRNKFLTAMCIFISL